MTRPLPPLNGLRAFEAAARHLSFKAAAEELHVTPAAISQQVRQLEEQCGRPLFRRLTRALALTDAGRAGAAPLGEGFARIAEAVALMRAPAPSRLVTVSVAPTFGAKWLLPRLARFRSRHPDYDLRIDASDELAHFDGDGVDVALRFGRGHYPGLVSECLMDEVSYPVCAPALLESGPPLRGPADLARHTLLHVRWKMESDSAPNWQMWLRAAGLDESLAERGPQFSTDAMALEAAIEGQGVVLAGTVVAAADLAMGRLVRPFPPDSAQPAAFGYYLVYPEDKAAEPRVRAFRDWVREEAAAETQAPAAEG